MSVFTMNSSFFFQKLQFLQWIIHFFRKKLVFFKNDSFYNELCSLFQKPQFLQWIIHCVAGRRSETFLAPGGVNGGAKPSRAEPGRAELRRADLSRAEPNRADSSRAVPNRAETSRAGGDPRAIFFKNSSFYNELCVFIPSSKTSVFTMNLTTLL